MNSSHETFDNTELIMDHLGDRSQTIGGARCVGQNRCSSVLGVINSHDVHGRIRRWRRDNHALGSSLNVLLGLINGRKDTCGFADSVGTNFTPRNI